MEQPTTGADLLQTVRSYQSAAFFIGMVELDICYALAEANQTPLIVPELAGRLNLSNPPPTPML